MEWYAFTNKADKSADVEIYDEIGGGGVAAKSFISALKDYEGKHLNLRINSPGGSIVDGQAIISALKRHTAGFTAYVDGLAASMASVIACSADKTYMADGAMMMIHRAQMVSMGDAEDLRKDASLLEKFEKSLLAIYSKKTGMGSEIIAEMLDKETWLDADEALTFGFIDAIAPATAATAKYSPDDFKGRFDKFANRMASPTNSEQEPLAPVVEPVVEPDPVAPVEPEPITTAVEPVVEPAPEVVEEVEPTPAEPSPEPTPETEKKENPLILAEAISNAANLAKEVTNLRKENNDFKNLIEVKDKELVELRAVYNAAKSAMGLMPSDELPPVAPAESKPTDIVAQYEAMPFGPERLAFYDKHKTYLFSKLQGGVAK